MSDRIKGHPSKGTKRASAGDTCGRSKPAKKPAKPSAYGEARPICTNAGCVLRKKAKCYGFEGCPGFKGT